MSRRPFALLFALVVVSVPFAAAADEPSTGGTDLLSRLDKGILRFQAGDFDATVHARVSTWAGWVGEDALLSEGDRMQEYGFRLRRARLGVEGHLFADATYKLEMDLFDQEKTGGPLYEAWVDYTPTHWIGVTLGFQKFPFARSEMASSARMAHLDRSIGVNAMAPANALGLTLHSELWKDHLTLSAGVFNGLQRKSGFFSGYAPVGISQGNKFERLSFVGRLDLEPMDKLGKHEADLDKTASFRLGLGGAFFYNDGSSVKTSGASAYVHAKAWGAHLLGELLMEWSKPTANPTTTNTINAKVQRMAVAGSIGYMILKDLLGVAARVELIDDNSDLTDEGDQLVATATLSYYAVRDYLKLQVEYQNRTELHGTKLSNDAALAGVQICF